MAAPTFGSAANTVVQATGTTNAPAIPSGVSTGSFLVQIMGVGSNVVPSPSTSFNLFYRANALSRPNILIAYKKYTAGDTGDPTGSNVYTMTTGAGAAANSGSVLRFEGEDPAANPFGTFRHADAAAAGTTVGVTLLAADYAVDDLLFLVVSLSSSRVCAVPTGWLRATQSVSANIHAFYRVGTTGDVVVPGMALTGGTAQSRVAVGSIKQVPATAFPDVIMNQTKKAVVGYNIVAGGSKKSITSMNDLVNQTKKPTV